MSVTTPSTDLITPNESNDVNSTQASSSEEPSTSVNSFLNSENPVTTNTQSQNDTTTTSTPAPATGSVSISTTVTAPPPSLHFPANLSIKDVPPTKEIEAKPFGNSDERLVIQTHAIVIPSYASWFNLSNIHEIEKRSLPEFFNHKNRSKTNDIYTRYRNFMVNAYRLNPAEYLTVTACRRNLVGDACAIMRVHSFLDKWGIINYQVNVEHRPKEVIPPFTGHWKVLQDTPRGLFPFKFYEGVDDPAAKKLPGGMSQQDLENAVAIEKEKARSMAHLTQSSSSSQTDATKNAFSTVKTNSTVSNSASIPSVSHRIDAGSNWSKKELLALLEGIEKHSNDWDKIASGVGTKTKEESILKFLSLSIEDPYLNDSVGLGNLNEKNCIQTGEKPETKRAAEAGNDDALASRKRQKTENGSISIDTYAEENGTEREQNSTPKKPSFESQGTSHRIVDSTRAKPRLSDWADQIGPLKYGLQNIPFAQAENPVLSVVSFLASLVDPSVVAAATGHSLKTIQEKLKQESEKAKDEDTTKTEKKDGDDNKSKVSEKTNTDMKKESPDEDVKMTDDSEKGSESNDSQSQNQNDAGSLSSSAIPFEAASSVLFGSISARSSVLQSRTERLLYTDLYALVSQQVYKTDAKLAKFLALENILGTERHEIERERMEVFLDRLVLAKKMKQVDEVLADTVDMVSSLSSEAIDTYNRNNNNNDDINGNSDSLAFGNIPDSNLKLRVEEKITQARKMVQEGCKMSIDITSNTTTVGAAAAAVSTENEEDGDGENKWNAGPTGNAINADPGDVENGNDTMTASEKAPQTFKLWSI